MVCKKLEKGKTPGKIAEELEEEPETIVAICKAAEDCGPDYSTDRIYEKMKEV